MNVYIVVDLEGISGISNGMMLRTGHAEWAARGRQLATAEVNAAIAGARAAGATRIWVKDGHDSGENLLSEALDPSAELLAGTPAVPGHMPGLDASFDTVMLVGFHARMGTPDAYLDHTVSTAAIGEVRVNGRALGEIGIYAANAGFYGVPVSLVTGDAAAVAEARELLGPIETVAVKHGLGRFSARVPSPERAHEQIRAAAERAAASRGQPFTVDTPVRIAVDFLRSAEADMAAMMPGAIRAGARTVEYEHASRETAFAGLQTMLNLGGIAATRWATSLYTTGNRVG